MQCTLHVRLIMRLNLLILATYEKKKKKEEEKEKILIHMYDNKVLDHS